MDQEKLYFWSTNIDFNLGERYFSITVLGKVTINLN